VPQTLAIKSFDVNTFDVERYDTVVVMPPPFAGPPIGVQLTTTSRAVSRAFDAALATADGSLPIWQVLLALKTQQTTNQRELAAAVGIGGATLTHHLDGMEASGLVTRRRDPSNRRMHLVELTAEGEAAFLRLRDVAIAHDQRLRDGIPAEDLEVVRRTLGRMYANVTTS
jgi:MarR family transcriptional regulator for hemolysin